MRTRIFSLVVLVVLIVTGVGNTITHTTSIAAAQDGCSISARRVGNMINQFEFDYSLPEGTYTLQFGDGASAEFSGSGTTSHDYSYPPYDYRASFDGLQGCATSVHVEVPEPPQPEGQCSLSASQGSAYNVFDFAFSGTTNQDWFHVSDGYGPDFDIPGNVGSTTFSRSYAHDVSATYNVSVSIAGQQICGASVTVTVPVTPPDDNDEENPPSSPDGGVGGSAPAMWTCAGLGAYLDESLPNRVHFFVAGLPGGVNTTVYFGDGAFDAGVSGNNNGYTWHDYDLSLSPFTAYVDGQPQCVAYLFVENNAPRAVQQQSGGYGNRTSQSESDPARCLPDNSNILVWKMWTRSFLVRMDAATDTSPARYTWLSQGLQQASNPQFSPNGCRLAFESDGNIWVVHIEGRELHPVLVTDETEELISWHANWLIEFTRDGAGYLANQYGGDFSPLQ